MQVMLNEQLPVQRKKRVAGYYWLVGAFIVAALALGYAVMTNSSESAIVAGNSVPSADDIINEQTNQIVNLKRPDANATLASATSNEKNNALNASSKKLEKLNNKSSSSRNSNLSNTTSTNKKTKVHNITSPSGTIEQSKSNAVLLSKRVSQSKENNIDSNNRDISTSPINSKNADASGTDLNSKVIPRNISADMLTVENSRSNTIQSMALKSTISQQNTVTRRLALFVLSPISLAVEPRPNLALSQIDLIRPTSNKLHRWEAYLDGFTGNEISGGSFGMNAIHWISPNISISTGLAFSHFQLKNYEQKSGTSPSAEIFTDANSYSGYLVSHNIRSSDFIDQISTLIAPIEVRYTLCDKMEVSAGIRPGVQLRQKISYAPILPISNEIRNPQIDNGSLTANDFFHKKSIAVVQSSLGIAFNVTHRLKIGGFYHFSLSDYGRSVSYASSTRLENAGAGQVDRDFYSIRSKEIRPKLFGLRLSYGF